MALSTLDEPGFSVNWGGIPSKRASELAGLFAPVPFLLLWAARSIERPVESRFLVCHD